MYERIENQGEFTMTVAAQYAASLGFARGKVGQRYPLISDEQKTEFAQECAEHTLPITKANTADCGDERITLSLADGTEDPAVLRARIVPQLFGGLGLASTKAAVAANAEVIRDAKNIWEAYLIISALLARMGEEDAGHLDCGASKSVQTSVENAVPLDQIIPIAGLLVPDNGRNRPLLTLNAETKRQRLESGFYGAWDANKHSEYLIDKFPQNYSYLQGDPNDHETHGHNGSGLYVVTNDNVGYQKTGRGFSVTLPKMRKASQILGGSDEERQRILLSFVGDTADVGAGIVTKDFPVFAQAA